MKSNLFFFFIFISVLQAEKYTFPDFFKNNYSWPLVAIPDSFAAKEGNNTEELQMHSVTYTNGKGFEISISNYGYIQNDGTTKTARDWVLINEIQNQSKCYDYKNYEIFVSPIKEGVIQAIYLKKNPEWGLCYQVLEFKADFELEENVEITNQIIKKTIPTFGREMPK